MYGVYEGMIVTAEDLVKIKANAVTDNAIAFLLGAMGLFVGVFILGALIGLYAKLVRHLRKKVRRHRTSKRKSACV